MSSAAIFPSASPWPAQHLPASFAASVAIHIGLLFLAGMILRAMPTTVGPHRNAPSLLTAEIILLADRSQELPPLLTLPEPLPPMREMLPPPIAPVSRNTSDPGLSSAPATIKAYADLAPVGKISYGFSTGTRLFGPNLAEQMKARYPVEPARPPRVSGSLSAMYPVMAAAQGRSQTLSALLSIDAEGHVVEVRVLPDDSVFVAAVMAALRNARFSPATGDGKPIPYWAVLDFAFKIDGPTAADGRRIDR